MHGALLLAAGRGRRMAEGVPDKLLHEIESTNSFRLSCEAFLNCQIIGHFIVVYRDEKQRKCLEQEFSLACVNVQRTVKPTFVLGGKERKDSVLNGLHILPDDCLFVQVHDCARPLIRTSTISTLSEKVLLSNSIAVARPVRDTVRRIAISNDSGPEEPQNTKTIDRSHLWMMETPQVCRKDLLLKGLKLALEKKVEVTDEISALELIGEKSIFHDPGYANPKITTFKDYEYLRFLIKNENDSL